MLGFLTFGTTLTFLDLALKNKIEAQDKETFPRELKGSRGLIWLYQNHNPGFSFGFLKNWPRAVELVPLCVTSALAGVWAYVCGTKGRLLEKTAMTLALAGGVSNLYDRLKRGYVVDYFSVQWKSLKKVVFNLGDIFIFLGMVLYGLSELVSWLQEKSVK